MSRSDEDLRESCVKLTEALKRVCYDPLNQDLTIRLGKIALSLYGVSPETGAVSAAQDVGGSENQ